MLTVQNDWIEYETEPVQARRVAVRGGAACAQRGPVGAQRVLTQAGLAPVARPVPGRGRTQPAARALRPAPAKKAVRLRLTRRGRVVLVVLPSLLLLSGALLAAPGVAEAAQPAAAHTASAAVAAPTVVVAAGDTLWSIAERVAPGTDPRATIAAIERANHLSDDALQAGDVLLLPAQR